MSVGSYVGYAVFLAHAQPLQGRRPAIAPLQKLPVSQPQIIVDNSFTIWIETTRATREFERCKSDFHVMPPKRLRRNYTAS